MCIKKFYKLGKNELFPICRSITGNGIRNTLKIFSKKDHRIAMAFFCLGQLLDGKILIYDFETVNTSFPKFLITMKKIGAKYEIQKQSS